MTMPAQTRLLARAGAISVFHRPGTTPWTLVAFGPRQTQVSVDRWWGSTLGRREGLDLIGISTTEFDWFPRELMAELLPAIRAAAKPDIVTYGFSMGGYGALKYASALGARACLGLSAQYSIDPADGTTGDRGMTYFDPDRHAEMRLEPGDFPDGAMVLWDPEAGTDDQHARAIAALPGIRAVKLRLAGHATAAVFSETRQLVPVCEHLVAGRTEAAIAAIRQARREAPTVLLAASALLEAHGHPRWAAQALERAQRRRVNPGRAIEARARAFERMGRPAAEIAALRAWVDAVPDDLEPRLRLVERLRLLGRPADSAAAAREAIAAGVTDHRLHGALKEAEAAVRAASGNPAAARRARPAPELLGETESLRLWFWPGEGPGSLVIFTPPSAAPAGPADWWGRNQAAQLGWTTVVFAAHRPSWYPAAEMAELLPKALAALPRGPRVTYGVGMGGYAALKHGRALGARATVALAPVFSIDPAVMPRDPRAQRQFDPERNAGMTLRRADLAPLPVIAYDPMIGPDRAQARRLAAMPRVLAAPLRRAGPALPAMLVETGRFGPVLRAALEGDGPAAVAALREARRRSPRLRAALAAIAEARGHAGWAAALRTAPPAEAPATPAPPAPPTPSPPVPATLTPGMAEREFAVQANALRLQRRHDAEETVLRRWIAASPAAPSPRLALANCLQQLGRPEDAALALLDAIRAGVRDAAIHTALSGLLQGLEWSVRVAEAAAAAHDATPPDAAALALSGEIALWSGQMARAEQAFSAALALEPRHLVALRALAGIEPDPAPGGAPGPHLATLLAALEEGRAPEGEWQAVINRLTQAGRSEAALLAGQVALRLHPASPRLARRMAWLLHAAERQEEAMQQFRRLAELQPNQALSWYNLIDVLMVMKRFEEGRDVVVRGLARHPADTGLVVRHANVLAILGEGAAAEREARRAVALDPAAEIAHLALVDALYCQERHGDALATARSAMEALPEAATIALRVGRLSADREDHAAAAAAYERVVALMPKPPQWVWVGLAEALVATGRATEAEAAIRRGLDADPGAQELRATLGQLLLGRGEAEAARDALAQAFDEAADSAAVSLAMAEALLRQGRKREALGLLEDAVALKPGHAPAEIRLGQLLMEDGRVEEAAALFTRLTTRSPALGLAWVGLADAERLRKQVKPALAAYRAAQEAGVDAQILRNLRFRLFGEYDG